MNARVLEEILPRPDTDEANVVRGDGANPLTALTLERRIRKADAANGNFMFYLIKEVHKLIEI